MKWKQIDAYHLAADGYTVAKVIVNGKVYYEAWHGRTCLGYRMPTPNAAIEVCERNAE